MLQAVQNGDAVSSTPSAAKVDAAGQFVLTGVTPGRYRLVASLPGSGKAGGWNVKSALIDGGDALDAPIDIQPYQTQATAEIAFSDHVAQLSGHLQHALGGAAPEYSIVVFPTDQALWTPHSRRIQSVRPAVDGGFRVRQPAAGRISTRGAWTTSSPANGTIRRFCSSWCRPR